MKFGARAAIAVAVAANLWMVLAAVRDRSAGPESVVTLDERELTLIAPEGDTSTVLLRLRVQTSALVESARGPARSAEEAAPPALGRAVLEAVGFDCSVAPAAAEAPAHYARALPRNAWIALAVGGAEWEQHVSAWQARRRREIESDVAAGVLKGEIAQEAMADIDAAPNRVARLWPVDADRSAEALRSRHADASRTLILRGVVRLHLGEAAAGERRLHGHVSEVFPATISVPAALAGPLEQLRGRPVSARPARRAISLGWATIGSDPRYEVQLAIGRAHQPWVVGVRARP
jgi:hypothetical protein